MQAFSGSVLAKSATACITSLCIAGEIILADFNLGVSTSTAKPLNIYFPVKSSGYTVCTYVCTYMCVCMYICMYVCMYVFCTVTCNLFFK